MRVLLKQRVLKEFIARKGFTQNGFALKAGISSGYMAQLLNGTRRPSGSVRQELLKASGMKFDDLFEIDHDTVARQSVAY